MTVSVKQLRAARWNKQFEDGAFRVFTTEIVPGMSLIHDGTAIRYRVKGKGETASLSQAVKWLNEQHKKQTLGERYAPPGSAQAIRLARGTPPSC